MGSKGGRYLGGAVDVWLSWWFQSDDLQTETSSSVLRFFHPQLREAVKLASHVLNTAAISNKSEGTKKCHIYKTQVQGRI